MKQRITVCISTGEVISGDWEYSDIKEFESIVSILIERLKTSTHIKFKLKNKIYYILSSEVRYIMVEELDL